MEPRDFVDNAICVQEKSQGNTTAFLNDPRKNQSSFPAEPLFSQAGGAAPGSAAWLGSHCWDRVRAERARTITGVALRLPFSWELHPCPDLSCGPFLSYTTVCAQPVSAGHPLLPPMGFMPAPSLGPCQMVAGLWVSCDHHPCLIPAPLLGDDGLTCHRRAWPCQPHSHSWLLACSCGAAHPTEAVTSLWNSGSRKDAALHMF